MTIDLLGNLSNKAATRLAEAIENGKIKWVEKVVNEEYTADGLLKRRTTTYKKR